MKDREPKVKQKRLLFLQKSSLFFLKTKVK
nr:MAG TPA: hypothetical protein [Caudoviricetes sp.]